MNHLIILRGPTRSGKSSIAKELCKELGFEGVDIDEIGDGVPSASWASPFDRYRHIITKARSEAERRLNNGHGVVVEEAFAEPFDISCLKSILIEPLESNYDVRVAIFHIWCPISIALERNKQSERPTLREEVVRHQHDRFRGTQDFGVKIDTSSQSVQTAVEEIKKLLR